MAEKRWGQSSHDHVKTNNVATQTRRDDGFEKFNNEDGQSPCTMCTMMSAPCSDSQTRRRTMTSAKRDDPPTPTPSACTCNNVFFNMWSACLYSNGNSSLPLYTNWGAECQKNSEDLKDGYPKQWADKVAIPDWARIEIPSTSKFDIDKAIQIARTPNPWGLPQILVPIAAVLGTLVLGSAIFGCYKLKGSKKGSSPLKFTHWLFPRRSLKVHQASRSDNWSIDRNDESDEYVMVDVDDEPRGTHVRFPSMEEDVEDVKSADLSNAEYQLPLKSIWKKSQIAQQIRRLPGQIPLPWKEKPIQITSRPPGRRFRVDSLNTSTESGGTGDPNSRSGTVEGGAGRPDTIFETEEYPVANDRNSMYENEGTSLISHSERDSNRVFLITHRPGDFTLESGSSNQNSKTSDQLVKIVPPTPTESSRFSQRHGSAVPPILDPPPRRPELPPAPRQPAPLPPGISPPTPRRIPTPAEQASRQAGPSAPPTPQPHPLHPQIVSSESLPLTPGPKRHNFPPANHVRRQPSKEDNDSLKRLLPATRPMGARLPSSPHHVARQLSLDELTQSLSPSVQSISASMYTVGSPSHSPRPLTPASHHRALSGDDPLPNHGDSLTTPRPQHSRNISTESLVPARGDPVMLFPGSVRGAGYTIGLPPAETESSASLYSTTSSGNARLPPGPAPSGKRL